MNDVYWREDTRAEEAKSRAKMWMVFSYVLFFLYCGMMFAKALFFDGSMRTAIITLIVALPLPAVPTVVYLKRLNMAKIPMVVAIATNMFFLVFGTYLRELDYIFSVMFIALGTVMIMKDFKMLLRTTIIIFVLNIIFIAFFLHRLDWLDHFRFIMRCVFFMFGSVFYLILTYNVDLKENSSDRALAAFTALLGSTPNLMAITDSSRRVYYLSNQFLKFIGYPRKEYTVGQPLIDLISDWRMKMIFADMLDAEGFYETEIDLCIDGEERHFKLTTDKLIGGFDGIFVDISDITPIVHARLAAEEANRTKSSFLATMSHEIRTPLNAIIGITQIQLQKDSLPTEYATALEKVNNAGNSLLGIINDILDMSKIETGNLELHLSSYDVPSLINDAVQLNIVRIGMKPIEFILEIDESMPSKMTGDELRLKQILNNLLSNAVKYTDEGSVKLSVRVDRYSEQWKIENGKLENERLDDEIDLIFTVSDTGQGIRADDMDKLFSMQYVRFNADANRTTEGTGLGLGITKRLVEMMDGDINVSSEYGEGSTFTVVVKQKCVQSAPIGAETAQRLREFSYVDGRYKERRKTVRNPMPYGEVMVVDDSASNLFVAEGLLSPYKLKIDAVDSGFKALDKISGGGSYDIIFMDHMMPRMDGIETTKKLREMGYNGAIVALTANALAGNEAMFAENGFDGYIPKPIDTRRLDEVLNKFVRDAHPEEAKFYGEERISIDSQAQVSPQLLQVFYREASRAAVVLREAVNSDDIKTLTVTVHAMKSALANIGQQELSASAGRLERAGLEDDRAFIKANADGFIGAFERLVDKLRIENVELRIDGDEVEISEEDAAFLREQLDIVIKACEDYDDSVALQALDLLGEKSWQRETADKLDSIRNALFLDSDFDGAAELAREMTG